MFNPNTQQRYNSDGTALQGYQQPNAAVRYSDQRDESRGYDDRGYVAQERDERGYYVSEGNGGLFGVSPCFYHFIIERLKLTRVDQRQKARQKASA
jgi:hypothetical protein